MLLRKVVATGILATVILIPACKRSEPAPTAAPASNKISSKPAAPEPKPYAAPAVETPNPWFILQAWQRTLTREEFEKKLDRLYDPFNGLTPYVDINDQRAVFYISPKYKTIPVFTLEFAPDADHRAEAPKPFRTPAEIRALPKPPGQPLHDLRIAIDPGHIGGKWAQVENRSTRYRGSAPVNEGDLNIITAHILKKQLTDLGAEVFLVREDCEPVTPYRPNDFILDAIQAIKDKNPKIAAKLEGKSPEQCRDYIGKRVQDVADLLFYRGSEIPERGNKIRREFQADITITLYINATDNSGGGRLTSSNRNIIFVHGSYTKDELADPNQRRQLVGKLLEDSNPIEVEVAGALAKALRQKTGLPPVLYGDSKTTRLMPVGNGYVVARNLAANRNYSGPVVCTEPYFMNNVVTYRRLLAGDYDGTKTFDGKSYPSIFRDYADAVVAGLIEAYGPPALTDNPAATTIATSLH